mmetsp:Transcript_30559/g.72749  ORF Transcript_30559/g.72749 Transcript_30559/m.72749 type:complete len:327 (+) Transcript_30559:520-1500(+)
MLRSAWPGHRALTQRRTPLPSSAETGSPHTGQWRGGSQSTSAPVLNSARAETTCGITSPARSTTTLSPILSPSLDAKLMLCSDARSTVTPPTLAGSSTATGVSCPVLRRSAQVRRRSNGARSPNARGGRRARCSAEGDLDAEERRDALLRGELPGHGPARVSAHLAERPLQREAVELEDGAVGAVAEAAAGAHPQLRGLRGPRKAARETVVRAHGEPERAQPPQRLPVAPDLLLAAGREQQLVGDEAEPPLRRGLGVEQAQRPGRGVPRVGELLPAGPALHLVHLLVVVLRHVHLAADLDVCGGGDGDLRRRRSTEGHPRSSPRCA